MIPSKSYAHRAYICDLLAGSGGAGADDIPADGSGAGVVCDLDSDDIKATRGCLAQLKKSIDHGRNELTGATRDSEGYQLSDRDDSEELPVLEAGESGSTLRFMMPLAGAVEKAVLIKTKGRLAERPMGPFEDELVRHGMTIEHLPEGVIKVSGKLSSGEYRLPGSISSQFITGLLLSLPYLDGDSSIVLTSGLQSSAYVDITIDVLKAYGVEIRKIEGDDAEVRGYVIPGGQRYHRESPYIVEGDWSQAAFWLTAGAIGKATVSVAGLDPESVQGDRKIVDVLRSFGARIEIENGQTAEEKPASDDRSSFSVRTGEGCAVCACPSDLTGTTIDVSEIPDLAPAIACAAAAASGETRMINAERLKFKESDRIASIVRCLTDLGVAAEGTDSEIIIQGCGRSPAGGTAETAGDHRIVMMAAVLSLITRGKVTITGSSAVSKSYPAFFKELEQAGLAGNIVLK